MTSSNLPEPFNSLPARACHVAELRQHSLVFRQGDTARAIWFLTRGSVQLHRQTETGDRITIHHARAGETFAEASLFSDIYHCDAVVTADGQAVRIDKHELLERLVADARFALAMASHFARNVQANRRRIEILAIRSAQDRVMEAIRDGMLDADIKSFASVIGLTHETTYRALSALVAKRKLARTGRGKYRLS